MEIKYTLEIVTKDIQDIGKLVENLHNSPAGSTLELDLALSKLRNVYDILKHRVLVLLEPAVKNIEGRLLT